MFFLEEFSPTWPWKDQASSPVALTLSSSSSSLLHPAVTHLLLNSLDFDVLHITPQLTVCTWWSFALMWKQGHQEDVLLGWVLPSQEAISNSVISAPESVACASWLQRERLNDHFPQHKVEAIINNFWKCICLPAYLLIYNFIYTTYTNMNIIGI